MEKRFGEILEIINGKNQKHVENPNGRYPIYGSGGVMGYADDYICNANTVVIGRKGSINKPIFVEEPFWNVDTAFGLVAKKGVLLPRYLYFFCEYFDFEQLNTTVIIPSLTKANLLNIKINLPTLEEQKEIVKRLDLINRIILMQKKQIESYDTLIKARFVEMFGNVQYEDRYCGIMLGELCSTISGGTPSTKVSEFYEGEIPWISTISLGANHINGESAKGYITEEAIKHSATHLIPAGNILFGIRVGVGKSSLNDVDICTN